MSKPDAERRAFYRSISRIGSHIRGRVVGPVGHDGRSIWRTEVYNVKTGAVVWDDEAFTYADAINEAHWQATFARIGWFYSFTRKSLR